MSSRIVILSLSGLFLAACATSHVMMGKTRPPISPELVTVYFHPPQTKYDEIAMINTSSRNGFAFTAQAKTDVVIRRFKEEAAKLGANGVLIQGIGDEYGGSVGTSVGQTSFSGNSAFGAGFGISGDVTHKAGTAIAIYVEPPAVN